MPDVRSRGVHRQPGAENAILQPGLYLPAQLLADALYDGEAAAVAKDLISAAAVGLLMVSTCPEARSRCDPPGVAQGILQQVAQGDGEQQERACTSLCSSRLRRISRLSRCSRGARRASSRWISGATSAGALDRLLAAQQQEGLGEQGHLVAGGPNAAGGSGGRGGQVAHLAEQGGRAWITMLGCTQLMAGRSD